MHGVFKAQFAVHLEAAYLWPTRPLFPIALPRYTIHPRILSLSQKFILTPLASGRQNYRRIHTSRPAKGLFRLGENKHELSVDTLGSSAEVLVLTDAAQRSRQRKLEAAHKKPVTRDSTKDGPSPADLLQSAEDARRLLDSSEIYENLEELHRTLRSQMNDEGLLAQKNYEDAKEALSSGFTNKQLRTYVRSFNIPSKSRNLEEPTSQSSKVYKCHTWTPGITTFPETALARLEATEALSPGEGFNDLLHCSEKTGRPKLLETILSQCWGFEIEEDLALLGELDLRISPHVRDLFFSLHGSGDRSLFARIAEEYGARIDASHSTGLLRITANYRSCQDTLRLIDFAMGQFRTDTFEVSLNNARDGISMPVIPAAQLETMWANIARHTKTAISASRSKERASMLKLTVWSVGPSDTDFVNVQRLVPRAIHSLKEETVPIFHPPLKTKSLRMTEIANNETFPWADNKPLYRWRLPEPFDKRENDEPSKRADSWLTLDAPEDFKAGLQSQYESLEHELIPSSDSKYEPLWTKAFRTAGGLKERYEVSATCGLLAFSPPESQHDVPRSNVNFDSAKTTARRFTSSTGYVSSLALQFPDTQATVLDQLKICLVPLISDEFLLRQRPPVVELGVRYDRKAAGTPALNIALLSGLKYADLMMPECHADIRFQSYQAMLEDEDTGFLWRPILQEFITRNKLDVWDSKVASVSPEVILPLPTGPAEETTTNGIGPSVPVRYQVISLEYRTRLRFNLAGFRITYSKTTPTSLDRTTEKLEFAFSKPNSNTREDIRKTFRSFYNNITTLTYNIRSEDYHIIAPAEHLGQPSNRKKAEQLLSELMRSTAVNLRFNDKRI